MAEPAPVENFRNSVSRIQEGANLERKLGDWLQRRGETPHGELTRKLVNQAFKQLPPGADEDDGLALAQLLWTREVHLTQAQRTGHDFRRWLETQNEGEPDALRMATIFREVRGALPEDAPEQDLTEALKGLWKATRNR